MVFPTPRNRRTGPLQGPAASVRAVGAGGVSTVPVATGSAVTILRLLRSAALAAVLLLVAAGPAVAAPATPSTAPARPSAVPRPTVDPSAASPTAPIPGGP